MEVLLKRNWFNPKGSRMRVVGKGTVHTMPDEWEPDLPSSAVILKEDAPVVPLISSKEPDTFSEMNKLQEGRRDTAEAIQEDVTLAASKKEQALRNRRAGAARARDAKLQKENENVQVD